METYVRNCPKCGKEKTYSSVYTWKNACENNSVCRKCAAVNSGFLDRYATNKNSGESNPFYGKQHSEISRSKMATTDRSYTKTNEFKRKMREVVARGSKHHMFGSSHYKIWVYKYGQEKADELELKRRQKTSSKTAGSLNPMYGKPSPQGSGCGWSGWYKGWFFRSLRELSYVVNNLEPDAHQWASAEKKELMIEYLDFAGKVRNYFADFIVDEKKLVEVKPTKLHGSDAVKRKQAAAELFCSAHGLSYELVDSSPLSPEEIKSLHDTQKIIFTKKYEKLYQENWTGWSRPSST
jgi:hypothetical protein